MKSGQVTTPSEAAAMATPATHFMPVAVKLVVELIHTLRKPEEVGLVGMPA